jgi:transcription elongation factor Elf1
MGSINKKLKKNRRFDLKLSIRFECSKCNYKKVISKEVMDKIKPNEFANNSMFKCPNCNIRMAPIEVIADF